MSLELNDTDGKEISGSIQRLTSAFLLWSLKDLLNNNKKTQTQNITSYYLDLCDGNVETVEHPVLHLIN